MINRLEKPKLVRIAQYDIGIMATPWLQETASPTNLSDDLRKAVTCINSAENQPVPMPIAEPEQRCSGSACFTWNVASSLLTYEDSSPLTSPAIAKIAASITIDESKKAEVTVEDIEDGKRDFDDRSKPGFEKLRFLSEKAESDGLSVVFYSKEGSRLGDKRGLVEAVATVTKIPIMALQVVELSRFSKKERFSWADNRKTSVPEDAAYCLLGIFNVRGVSWCDLNRLDQKKLGELDSELEGYVRWLLDIFPTGKKMEALLANFGVHYEDLSSMEATVKTWTEPWARYNDRSESDQIRTQAFVENRWY
ncbi:hypothetical protein BHYA_0714g00020 [Botrytis hyacinthi]|uniref:Uncharacterized protein n=1 Tax=Botrytis hyacinthi TaxID=278943 RepID=A0A4Z1GBP3_9HELO|nr:hypothetical protein BHYA_0714g00020 [Botrytis hyacinthi]